jgi:hypothetical protein
VGTRDLGTLYSYSTQNQQRPYQKLSEKWLLITSLSGCSLEQKLPSSVTHSPDRTRPGTPFLTSAIPGLRSVLECRNLISSNSFAHRLGTGNSALRLAPGPVGLKLELRQERSRPLTSPKKKRSRYVALDFSADFLFLIFYFVSSFC